MKTLSLAKISETEIDNHLSPIADEQRVLNACRDALELGRSAVQQALVAGTLLLEYRESLKRSSHSGNSNPYVALKHNQGTAKDDQFLPWLARHNIARNTAYRWMNAAERVSRFALGIRTADVFSTTIEVEGVVTPLSQVLEMPEDELSGAALEYKQGWLAFMQDKTLSEAAGAVVDGESQGSRITRAVEGKSKGGKGEQDRKEFALFAGRALADCVAHIGASVEKKGGHWRGMSATAKQEAKNYVHLFLMGLPSDVLEFIRDAARVQLLGREKGNLPEPLALKMHLANELKAKAMAGSVERRA